MVIPNQGLHNSQGLGTHQNLRVLTHIDYPITPI